MQQVTKNLLMVKPAFFSSNPDTISSNEFQHQIESSFNKNDIQISALSEFIQMATVLRSKNINIHIYDDIEEHRNPDAIFPNNWVTFHECGTVVLYPMMSPKRRTERRLDIIKSLSSNDYFVRNIIDMSYLEKEEHYLEGTGSMVFDRVNRKAYACLSSRTSRKALSSFSKTMDYEIIEFTSSTDVPIYHTNVMMSLGEETALVCFDVIKEKKVSKNLKLRLEDSGRVLINVSIDQMNNFLGNALEVKNEKNEKFLLMSETAKKSLTFQQKKLISEQLDILSFPIPTIEKYGGGSVRCMLAEIFLNKGE
jgi:hypothetical protein